MAVMPAIVPGPPSATAFALAAVSSSKPRKTISSRISCLSRKCL